MCVILLLRLTWLAAGVRDLLLLRMCGWACCTAVEVHSQAG